MQLKIHAIYKSELLEETIDGLVVTFSIKIEEHYSTAAVVVVFSSNV